MWRRVDMQPPAHAGSSLADFSIVKMEAIRFFETSVHTRPTRRHIPEDGILQNHGCENLKSYIYEQSHVCFKYCVVTSIMGMEVSVADISFSRDL
jgi:hypothetical protein